MGAFAAMGGAPDGLVSTVGHSSCLLARWSQTGHQSPHKMQGFNRYYPPDFDPKKTSTLNKLAGKHALGDRARKLDKGILITRFELPFNIWCGHCNAHIGMGVRYNAEKKKIGNYYSTPIWSFRCKCHLCAGWFEIQTDPKNTRYVVTEGAKAQVQDWDPEAEGSFAATYTKEGEDPTSSDAFAKLEKTTTSKTRAFTAAQQLDAMEDRSEQRWSDPYSLNKNLRKSLREDKGKAKEKVVKDDELADRYGLGSGVRLDLVRGEEEQREDDTGTAAWLSRADKREVKATAEEMEVWEAAKASRRRMEQERHDQQAKIVAETGWKERTLVKRDVRPTSSASKVVRTVAAASSPAPSSAVSKLSSQLRLNSARKSDPFGAAFSSSTASTSLAGALRKPARK